MTRYAGGPLKRAVDVIAAGLAGVVLLPVVAVLAALLLVADGRPVLFRQQRIGRGGRGFDLLKFRTMRDRSGGPLDLLSDAERVHRLGALLRRTSLDELPSLLNVLRGDMSLVGPRPLLALHLPLYEDTHPERLTVRPGITGLAQVRGRQDLSFRARLDADVEYARRASLGLDLGVLLRTVGEVVRGSGVRTGQELDVVDDIGLRRRIVAASRAEHGSFLEPHGPVGRESSAPTSAPGDDPGAASPRPTLPPPLPGGPSVLLGTARQALAAALAAEIAGAGPRGQDRPIRRLLLPAYYCDDVAEALADVVDVERYPWLPPLVADPTDVVEADDDDAVVVLGFLGARPSTTVRGGRLIVDATHTLGLPWSETDASGRPADWCVASLRKTLPLPDGALLWSPRGRPPPTAPSLTAHHAGAAAAVRDHLARKREFLAGGDGEKSTWLAGLRAALVTMEAGREPSAPLPSTTTEVARFDVGARWSARSANHAAVVGVLGLRGVLGTQADLLPGEGFVGLLFHDPAVRDVVLAALLDRRIYPAVLWPQADGDGAGGRFAARLLVLHVDARYSTREVRGVADAVADALASAGPRPADRRRA